MPRCWFIKAAANNELPQCCIPQLWSAFFLKSTRWQRGNLDPTLCQKTHTASESIFSTQHQSEAGPHSTTGHPLVEIKCGACTDVVLLPLMLFYSLYNSRSQIVVKWGRKRRRGKKKRSIRKRRGPLTRTIWVCWRSTARCNAVCWLTFWMSKLALPFEAETGEEQTHTINIWAFVHTLTTNHNESHMHTVCV